MDYTITQIRNKLRELTLPLPNGILYMDLYNDVALQTGDEGSTIVLYTVNQIKLLEVGSVEEFMSLNEDSIWEALRKL